MTTKTKTTTAPGKQAWQWIVEHSRRVGMLVCPEGKLTVAMLEAACGKGALSAARRYCEGVSGMGTGALGGGEKGEVYPYAGGVMDWRAAADETDHQASNEWSAEQKDEYYRTYWLPTYGPNCQFTRRIGCERPADLIYVRYPQVG